MKGNCGECGRRWYCEISPDDCNEWPDPVPQTNADRIRSMTDEELANFVHEGCPYIEEECTMKGCVKCILEWLQQPAEIFSR